MNLNTFNLHKQCRTAKRSEHAEQVALCEYMKMKGLIYSAIPNGMFLKDKIIASKIMNNMRKEGLQKGFPDLIILEPRGGFHGCFIEMKKHPSESLKKNGEFKKGVVKPEQLAWAERVKRKGYYHFYGLGCEDAIVKLEKYLKL